MQDLLIKNALCDSCKREIRDIYVCSSSHLSCSSCAGECSICGSVLCLSCTKKRCGLCSKKLCKKCVVNCFKCHKSVCKIHSNKNYLNERDYCMNCLEKCDSCGKFAEKSKIKRLNNRDICEKCFRLSGIK